MRTMSSDPTDVENPATSSNEEQVTPVAEDPPKVEQEVSTRSTSCWWYAARYFFGLLFSLLFLYSFAVQFNDTDSVGTWAIFYLLHGLLAVMGLINLLKIRTIMVVLAGGMIVWSIVMIITASLDLAKTEAGGGVEGGDNNNATVREEKAYELAGACVGTMSGLFHFFLFKYSPPPASENPDLSEPSSPVS
jgi:hypothetical protein